MLGKIDVVSSTVIGLTSVILTMSVVIISFDKKYYLVLSIKEILKDYRFYTCIRIIVISCLMTVIFMLTLLNQDMSTMFDAVRFLILEVSVISNLLSIFYAFYLIMKLLFSEEKADLKLNDKLYTKLGNINIKYIKSCVDWDQQSIRINLENFAENFMINCQNINNLKIEKIEFMTPMICYKDKWYKKIRPRVIVIITILTIISVLIDITVLQRNSFTLLIINLTLYCIMLLIMFLKSDSVKFVMLSIYSDTWGYYLRFKNGKEKFVPRSKFFKPNQYDKFIYSLNNLVIFFYIQFLIGIDNEIKKDELNFLQNLLNEFENNNNVISLPVFIINYLFFKENIEIDQVKQLYKELKFNKFERQNYTEMLNIQIFNLMKYEWKGSIKFQEELNPYINWLQENAGNQSFIQS